MKGRALFPVASPAGLGAGFPGHLEWESSGQREDPGSLSSVQSQAGSGMVRILQSRLSELPSHLR